MSTSTKVQIPKLGKTIDCELKSNLMFELMRNEAPVASSCYGEGICGKCRVFILKGAENASLPNEHEKFLQQRLNFSKNERLSCQVEVLGPIEVDTKYW